MASTPTRRTANTGDIHSGIRERARVGARRSSKTSKSHRSTIQISLQILVSNVSFSTRLPSHLRIHIEQRPVDSQFRVNFSKPTGELRTPCVDTFRSLKKHTSGYSHSEPGELPWQKMRHCLPSKPSLGWTRSDLG